MKKIIKKTRFLLLAIVALFIFFLLVNQPLPKGTNEAKANTLAIKMLENLNFSSYKNTEYLEWEFVGGHHYQWNKLKKEVVVSWSDKKVKLYLKEYEKSYLISGEGDTNKLIKKAIDYFNNDSFWLVAPYKIFDEGTKRSIVDYKGKEALLITYTSGGSTPGDSYLWILDENAKPISFKMWVSIIPIGGLEASWSDWTKTTSGVFLPTKHKIWGIPINITKLKTY